MTKVPVRKLTWAEMSAKLSIRKTQLGIMRAALERIVKLRGGITDKIARKALKAAEDLEP